MLQILQEYKPWIVFPLIILGALMVHVQIMKFIATVSLREHLSKDGKEYLGRMANWLNDSGPFKDPTLAVKPLWKYSYGSIGGIPFKEAADSHIYLKFKYLDKNGSSRIAWAKATMNAYRVKNISIRRAD